MSTSAYYGDTPILFQGQVTAANTARDGTGTLVTLCTGPASGGAGKGRRIRRVRIKATVTTTAGMVRFFISEDNGTTKRLLTEVPVTAITVSASVAGFEAVVDALTDLILANSNHILYGATHNAEAMNILGEAMDAT